MPVECLMHEDVAGDGGEPAAIAGLVATAADQQRGIGAEMMMPLERAPGFVQPNFLPGEDERHQPRFRSGGTLSAEIMATASSRLITF